MTKALPDFVIIGAAKAATTWIAHALQNNPGVYLPDPEPHFFGREYARGLDWYAGFFTDAAPGQVVGEKSAAYLHYAPAAERIARHVPHAPLVAQLRNPVERAYSHYRMLYRRGTIRGRPEDYLVEGRGDFPHMLEAGLYARHLTRYFDHFPREQIKVFLFEDVRSRPQAIIAEVSHHIGVAPHVTETVAHARVNDSAAHFLPLPMRRALAPFKRAVQPLRGHAMFEAARASLARTPQYPPLGADLRAYLEDYYAADVAMLARIIGRDLSAWAAPERKVA